MIPHDIPSIYTKLLNKLPSSIFITVPGFTSQHENPL